MDSHWLEVLVKKFDREKKISKVICIENVDALPKGENYTTLLSRGTLNIVLGSGVQSTRQVIIKEKKGHVIKELNPFKMETMIYQNVLSGMEDLMNEVGDTEDTLWCKMLGYKPYNVIVLEDLTIKGFKVVERRNCLDLEHSLLVVRSLAKFHSLSKILLERGRLAKDDLGAFGFLTNIGQTMIEGGLRQLSQTILKSWPSKWKPIGLKIQEQISEASRKMLTLCQLQDDGFIVANHGDCWSNNILFKYEPFNKNPIGLKFVDFQISHYNSYMFDLVYFMYISTVPDIRRKHLNGLLQAYHEALSYYLKSYSYQGKIPSLEDVKAEHERALFWSFLCVSILHPLLTGDTIEALDIDKLVPEHGQEALDFINPDVLSSEKLINSIGPDFEFYSKHGTI